MLSPNQVPTQIEQIGYGSMGSDKSLGLQVDVDYFAVLIDSPP
ncbi:Uncharacterised protein [Halioglobus japonicus]|nr:Uncharacterised protein [Halioglobus japonicus]